MQLSAGAMVEGIIMIFFPVHNSHGGNELGGEEDSRRSVSVKKKI